MKVKKRTDINARVRLGVELALDRLNVWSNHGGDGSQYINDLVERCCGPSSPCDLSEAIAHCLIEIVDLKARSLANDLVRMVFERSKPANGVGALDPDAFLLRVVHELWRLEKASSAEIADGTEKHDDSGQSAPASDQGHDVRGGVQS
jgi:hypothetical protein